ncbi:MAG: hypothetical protein ABL933_07090 [Methyloglobulus sp.]|nr:hypothetical protein [Methyloglobulus sp.]
MGESSQDRRSGVERRAEPFRRFKDISVSERILNTVFLLTIGLGYLAALANLYYTHQGLDGKAGLSLEDIEISYHGSNTQTRLGTAIQGIMEPNLKFKSDKDVILAWIHAGAHEKPYEENIAPILNRDCIGWHSPSINPSLPDLTNYKGVSIVAHAGGATIPFLIRVSHIHLFGIAFILFFVGKIFLLYDMNIYIKRIAVVIPFAGMLLDVMSWFVTKSIPSFAYLVIASGALMGLSMGLQVVISVYQMWFYTKSISIKPSHQERH